MKRSHWNAFIDLLLEVQDLTGIDIDIEHIQATLGGAGAPFPTGAAFGADALLDSELLTRSKLTGFELLAMAVGTPQYRDGFDEPTLRLSIADTRATTIARMGQAVLPVSYDLFRGGRRVLEIYGLRLDQEAKHSSYYPRHTLESDLLQIWRVVPELGAMPQKLIASFPDNGDARIVRVKNVALTELYVN